MGLPKQDNVLNIEFKITNKCNFRCTYCFEQGTFGSESISRNEIEKILERVTELSSSKEFQERFTRLNFTLWGGEPTLNVKTCNTILKYAENRGIHVSMYTNGTGLQHFEKYIRSGTLSVQISYDGEPLNSLKRLDANNNSSTAFVKKQIDYMIENELPFTLKSTITPDCFKHMPECWNDIFNISQKAIAYNAEMVSYCPTIDYFNIDDKYTEDLQMAMVEMAKLERKHIVDNNHQCLLTWFGSQGDSYCSAGANIIVIDMDGEVYPCHGSLYVEGENKEKLNWCSIYDTDFINIITEKVDIHKNIKYNVPEECKSMYQTYNVRCNSESFNKSLKDTYEEKWTDYTNYLPLNTYFDIISKVTLALKNIMEN